MTIDELYQAFDNITLFTKFYIIDNIEGYALEWGSTFFRNTVSDSLNAYSSLQI